MLQFQGDEVLLELPHMNEVCRELGIVAAALPSNLLDDQLGVAFHQKLSDPKTQGCHQAEDQSLVLCHIVGGLEPKVHHVLDLTSAWINEDHTGSGPLLVDGPVEVECPVGFDEDRCLDFWLWGSGVRVRPPRVAWGRSHSAMKSARIWLLTAWQGWNSSWNLASSTAYLAMLPVALELWRMALNG